MKRGIFLSLIVGVSVALAGCTATEMLRTGIDIARGGDPGSVIQSRVRQKVESRKRQYAVNPARMVADAKAAKADFNKIMSFLMKAAGKQWGDDTAAPTRKRYVKYVENYKSRAIVDYDDGLITVETLIDENPSANLRNAIVTTLLTPEDPRAVDLFSARRVRLGGEPFLDGLVTDQQGAEIDGPDEAEAYADYLVNNRMKQRQITVAGEPKTVHYAEFHMVSDYVSRNARKYLPLAEKYAKRWGVSRSLVLAVIKTESNFNPYATSSVPAYGLMQLVPATGGRDAYRYAKGTSRMPSKDYLYDPEKNVELGTAYLSLLETKHFDRIQNPTSREYCVISAYNTGSGNVYRTFSPDATDAVNRINSMQPPNVYSTLKKKLPYEETRHYLVEVLAQRRQFVSN